MASNIQLREVNVALKLVMASDSLVRARRQQLVQYLHTVYVAINLQTIHFQGRKGFLTSNHDVVIILHKCRNATIS